MLPINVVKCRYLSQISPTNEVLLHLWEKCYQELLLYLWEEFLLHLLELGVTTFVGSTCRHAPARSLHSRALHVGLR